MASIARSLRAFQVARATWHGHICASRHTIWRYAPADVCWPPSSFACDRDNWAEAMPMPNRATTSFAGRPALTGADLDSAKIVEIDLGGSAFKQDARRIMAEWAQRPP